MPVWGWILVAAIVVLVAVAIVAGIAVNRRHRTASLKERFGPEYERTVSAAGEQKAAEKNWPRGSVNETSSTFSR